MPNVMEWLDRQPKWALAVFTVVLSLLIGFVDWKTSPEIAFTLFYLVPISMAVWLVGRRTGIFVAILCAFIVLTSNLLYARVSQYSNPAIPYWNLLMRLGVFLTVVYLLSALKNIYASLEKKVEARTAELRKEILERQRMEREILEVSEREQKRLGQDMHDGIGQQMTGVAFMCKVLQQKLSEKSLPEDAAEAGEIAGQIHRTVEDVRRMAKGLFPVGLEDGGLDAAMENLRSNVESQFGVSCFFSANPGIQIENTNVIIHLYRIAQEAVTNAVRHGNASEIRIDLSRQNGGYALTVQDDGIGIVQSGKNAAGMGLHIMRYRAGMIRGALDVQKAESGGTRVTCLFTDQAVDPDEERIA